MKNLIVDLIEKFFWKKKLYFGRNISSKFRNFSKIFKDF